MLRGKNFELFPFTRHAGDVAAPALTLYITGNLQLSRQHLQIRYQVSGDSLSHVIWPAKSGAGARRDNLWQHSCFECFISQRHQADYLELNFSPSGDWAMYHFQSYRAASTKPKLDERDVNIVVNETAELYCCDVSVNLPYDPQLLPADVGVTCVIETQLGLYYYALTHLSDKADFHQRGSFVLFVE